WRYPFRSGLADDFHVATRQVKLVLGRLTTRAIAACRRFPYPFATDTAVFRLGDADERLLRYRVDRVIIHVKTEDEAHCPRLLVEQRVGLVHGRHPAARDALVGAVAVAGLVAGLGGQGPAVGPRFVGPHTPLGGNPAGVFHDREVVRQARVELDTHHA